MVLYCSNLITFKLNCIISFQLDSIQTDEQATAGNKYQTRAHKMYHSLIEFVVDPFLCHLPRCDARLALRRVTHVLESFISYQAH